MFPLRNRGRYLPTLPVEQLADQFAYRPTCSTTAVLVALDHHVAQYLESVSYVRCLVPGTAAVRRRRHRQGLKPRPAAKLTVPNR